MTHLTSNLIQAAFRFRTSGESIDATFNGYNSAAQNADVNVDVSSGNVLLCLRFLIQENGGADDGSAPYHIRVSTDTYANDLTTSSTGVRMGNASASAQGADVTVSRLTGGSGSFVNGELTEDGTTDNIALTANNHTEIEFGLECVSADLTNGQTIDLRVYRSNSPLDSYSVTPRITITKLTAVTGTLSYTEAADTSSISGDVIVSGSLSASESSDSSNISGDVLVSGDFISTEPSDTVLFNGLVLNVITGTLEYTETADSAAINGEVADAANNGTLAYTESQDSTNIQGNVVNFGQLNATEPIDNVAFNGIIRIDGDLAYTETQDVVSLAGTIAISGVFTPTEAQDNLLIVGQTISEQTRRRILLMRGRRRR